MERAEIVLEEEVNHEVWKLECHLIHMVSTHPSNVLATMDPRA